MNLQSLKQVGILVQQKVKNEDYNKIQGLDNINKDHDQDYFKQNTKSDNEIKREKFIKERLNTFGAKD